MKLRVSFIDFLNSVPLGWSFLKGDLRDQIEILHDVPSECARHLANGQADVGLIPVIEYQNIAGLRVLPGISIASRHEVRSVLFVSKVPLEAVRSVALDLSSRTSVALLKVLLAARYGRTDVRFERCIPDPDLMLERSDAALIIGNTALRPFDKRLLVVDLAREWYRFTGLPFVFAFWAVRQGVDLGDRADLFYRSREEGLRNVELIVSEYADRLPLGMEEIRAYLVEHLDYSLGELNLRGLETFYRLASEHGLIDRFHPVEFYPIGREIRT